MPTLTLAEDRVFLEGLRWHAGRFWASDVYAGKVIAVDLEGVGEEILAAPAVLSGLGWLPTDELLVVSVLDDRILRLGRTGLVEHANLSALTRGHPNDMTVDDRGRAYVGTMGFDINADEPVRPGVIIRVDPDGTAAIVADDLLFPNGLTIHAARTLIVAESCGQRLTAFTIAPDGSLSDRRLWAQFAEPYATGHFAQFLDRATLAPDGIAADPEGNVWVADPLGRRAVRVARNGKITCERSLNAPEGIYSCAIGGPEGKTLAVCAAPSHEPKVLSVAPRSRLVAFDVQADGCNRSASDYPPQSAHNRASRHELTPAIRE
jgi:sugar lactone lactonase YvrE